MWIWLIQCYWLVWYKLMVSNSNKYFLSATAWPFTVRTDWLQSSNPSTPLIHQVQTQYLVLILYSSYLLMRCFLQVHFYFNQQQKQLIGNHSVCRIRIRNSFLEGKRPTLLMISLNLTSFIIKEEDDFKKPVCCTNIE